MTAYSEETEVLSMNQGLYTADLPSAIPNGYCEEATNVVPTGASIENRLALRNANIDYEVEALSTVITHSYMSFLGKSDDPDDPIMIWGDIDGFTRNMYLVRNGDEYSTTGGSSVDAYVVFPVPDSTMFLGAVNYNGTVYFATESTVYRIDSINWTTGAITTTSIEPFTGITLTGSMIHFFDRLWVIAGNKLFYTDTPTSPGAAPETWNVTANFETFVGKAGSGIIYKVIPYRTRLLIFTSVGLFTLSVIGSPSEWTLRSLDQNARVNTHECAFEKDGIVYYATDTGVYTTDGTNIGKVSGPIENQFLSGNFNRSAEIRKSTQYRLSYFGEGMLLSITVFEPVSATTANYLVDDSQVFFSRLDNVAWSKWDFVGSTEYWQLGGVIDSTPPTTTYANKTPYSFIMTLMMHPSDATRAIRQLKVYDGYVDQAPSGNSVPPTTAGFPIFCTLKSRFTDSGNPVDLKQFKYAYLNCYSSAISGYTDLLNSIDWVTDFDNTKDMATLPTFPSSTHTGSDKDNNEYAMLRMPSEFWYRLVQLSMNFQIDPTNPFYKIRECYLVQHTTRDAPDVIN